MVGEAPDLPLPACLLWAAGLGWGTGSGVRPSVPSPPLPWPPWRLMVTYSPLPHRPTPITADR